MRTLGKLLVIWGVLVPLMILPTTSNHLTRYRVAVVDVSFDYEAWIGPVPVSYANVVIFGLFVVGVGLSFWALPRMAWNAPEPGRGKQHG
jgi:hypothetical protein